MKKVKELRDGMKILIPFKVIESKVIGTDYPFKCVNDSVALFLTKDCKNSKNDLSLEIYEQEEILTLTPIEMEVSHNGVMWAKTIVFGKVENSYLSKDFGMCKYARPIKKMITLEIPEELLTEELRKYLK